MPFQRLRGRKMHPPLLEFGECIQFMPLDIAKRSKMAPRTMDGVYLGVNLSTGESIVGTKDGVYKAKSLHRKPLDQRWDADQFLNARGTTWKPYHLTEDDRLRVNLPNADDLDLEPRARTSAAAEEYVPRTFKIERRDIPKYKATPNCTGCYHQMHGFRHRPHTPV